MEMDPQDFRTRIAHEALILLGVLALLTFICRLWPILLLILLGIFIAALRLLFLSARKESDVPPAVPIREPPAEPTERDLQNMAYRLILARISELVAEEYPNAKWVWAQPNAKRMILEDEDVFILLNHAGGYAKAKVKIHNLKVCGLEYGAAENYGLIAFQWVETHTLELNDRCNNAIGQGEELLILGAGELPAPESWKDICAELNRVGIANAECTEVGIKIHLLQ